MTLGVIPARYGSVRFPGKPLARLNGKPLIQQVWERVREAKSLDELVVATDDERIVKAVEGFGGKAVQTSTQFVSGTDRVWAVAKETKAELIVNIQGDEPLLTPGMVDKVVEILEKDPEALMATLSFRMKGAEGYTNPNVVKVVTDEAGWALYFSRSPIPAYREKPASPNLIWFKHLGIYGYRRKLLSQFVGWSPSDLEKKETLEQLRVLEHGVRIKVAESPSDTIGVDTLEDLKKVEAILKNA